LGTEEIELQTQVIDVEACDSAPEPEAVNELCVEQVPEEAVEVTVWSSVDDTMANQESESYSTNDISNQNSEEGISGVEPSHYRIKKKAVVITEEGDSYSKELFSQDELSSRKVVQGEVVRILGDTQTICSVDVVVQPHPADTGSSFSLFSTPSGEQRQQAGELEVPIFEVEPAEVPAKSHEIEIPMANCSPVKKSRGINGVVPPRPLYSLPSFLGNLADLVKSAVWFKNPLQKRPHIEEEPRITQAGKGEKVKKINVLKGSPGKRVKLNLRHEKPPLKKKTRKDEERREALVVASVISPGRPAKRAKIMDSFSQGFAMESDTEAEMTVINGRISDVDESSSFSETETPVGGMEVDVRGRGEVAEGKDSGSLEKTAELKKAEERVGTGQEKEEVPEDIGGREEKTRDIEDDRKEMDVPEESLNTLEVDVVGSSSPRDLVIGKYLCSVVG